MTVKLGGIEDGSTLVAKYISFLIGWVMYLIYRILELNFTTM